MSIMKNSKAASLPSVLFLDKNAGEDQENLLYYYPRVGLAEEECATKLKGLLLALKGLLDALSGQRITQVELHSKSISHNANLKAVFSPFQDTVVVVLLPLQLSDFVAEHLAKHLTDMIHFIHGDPDVWGVRLMDPEEAAAALRVQLDQLFYAAFSRLFGENWQTNHFLTTLPLGVAYLCPPPWVRLELDEMLSRLECVRPPLEERLLQDPPVLHHSLTALFHRGVLVASHLPGVELQLVWNFCSLHGLADRTEDHPRVILLQEVHIPPEELGENLKSDSQGDEGTLAPSHPDRQRVLLVVGLGEDLLCVLFTPLHPLTNSTAPTIAASPSSNAPPLASQLHQSIYLDAAIATLYHLRSSESGVRSALTTQLSTRYQSSQTSHRPPSAPSKGAQPVSNMASLNTSALSSLLHYVTYDTISGCILSSPLSIADLPSTATQKDAILLQDFLATSMFIRKTFIKFERCRRGCSLLEGGEVWDEVEEGAAPGRSPSAGLEPHSCTSSRRHAGAGGGPMVVSPLPAVLVQQSLAAAHSSVAASLAQTEAAQAKRLGSGEPQLFCSHREYWEVGEVEEVTLALRAHPGGEVLRDDLLVTGRRDARGREFYICHHAQAHINALEEVFHLAFTNLLP